MMENEPSGDDKLWAGVGYVGLFLCCGLPIVSFVIFLIKKDTSAFIKFQSLQATAFGIVSIVVSIVLGVLNTLLSIIPVIGPLIALLLVSLFCLAILGYAIYLAYNAFQGKDTEIPYVGSFIRANLMN